MEPFAEGHRFVLFGQKIERGFSRSRVLGGYLRLQDLQRGGGAPTGKAAEHADPTLPYFAQPSWAERPSAEELCDTLAAHDVISFDIFDTVLLRAVEMPDDVFRLMGVRLGVPDFPKLRKNAESHVREISNRQRGHREVTLSEIYDHLIEHYGARREWEELELELELELSRPNPLLKQVYDRMRDLGKTIVFMTDMYLPRDAIERLLARNGYEGYEGIYLSNEHASRKGDGTLQPILLADYPGRSVVHVGDNLNGDVLRSREVGLEAVHTPDVRSLRPMRDMGSLAGSFYNAVVNNALGNGGWDRTIHYTHGFRVGGILALGYVEYLDRLADEHGVDRILFCGRDCDVISRVYERFYGSVPSRYVSTSRFALLGLTLERNFHDYIHRSFFRWLTDSRNTRTIGQVMEDTGFGYLVPYLEESDIEQYLFPSGGDERIIRRRLEAFFWQHRDLVAQHNARSREAAKAYFGEAIGDAKRVLVVDIGWAGTTVSALREFVDEAFPERNIDMIGALMCTSRSRATTDAITSGSLHAYVSSPIQNMDLTKAIMPGRRMSVREGDLLHHPLEYLFTEATASVTGYDFAEDGTAYATRGNNQPHNLEQIHQMQQGIIDFVAMYRAYSDAFSAARQISAYVAFVPLLEAIEHPDYCYEVYKDFHYDAAPTLFAKGLRYERFGELYEPRQIAATPEAGGQRPKILFISPEMIYAGAPRSLLRLCKVASDLGYEPLVWTKRTGAFAQEFEEHGFHVQVMDPNRIDRSTVRDLKANGVALVVANTILTDEYVRRLEGKLPLVWYVREAANLPDFLRAAPERAETLRKSTSVCCVSDYAAAAISKYTDGPVAVVRNAVEDVAHRAQPGLREGGKHRFVQLGTIEQRKGYDLLIAAFKALPESYRERSELHFAGGFINSGTTFASYVLAQAEREDGIHFHGLVTGEDAKIALIAQSDTVVVSSRDESCSLVALEGAMLSKPLIVSENVGAKYVVDAGRSGFVVPSDDVDALRDALMHMIDVRDDELVAMGKRSRERYEAVAGMDTHRSDLQRLFAERIAAGPVQSRGSRSRSDRARRGEPSAPVIVSLTSFPKRIRLIGECIDSLLDQTFQPDRVVLWLSKEQFPGLDDDLPRELLDRVGERFQIEWVDDDLGPHKKYFYAVRRYPDALVITVDDDARYDRRLVEHLVDTHMMHPHAVIADRANLILFRKDGSLREYDGWAYNVAYMRDMSTYQLLPTGLGGVLYPPGSIPEAAFDVDAIKSTSLFADDLWLKAMTTANGYPVRMPRQRAGYRMIEEAQSSALWRLNAFHNGNDEAIERILEHFDRVIGSRDDLLRRIRGVTERGEFHGPRAQDVSPLPGARLDVLARDWDQGAGTAARALAR